MKLPENIFKSTEEYLEFMITEIEKRFGISYQVLYKHIVHWSEQGLIIKDTFPPRLGGPKLKFWLSEEAKSKLKSFLKIL